MIALWRELELHNHRVTTDSHPLLHFFPFAPTDNEATAILIMSSHSHTATGPSSDVIPLSPPPVPVFELNQARRGKLGRELETLRGGTYACPKFSELDFKRSHVCTLSRTLIRPDHLQRS